MTKLRSVQELEALRAALGADRDLGGPCLSVCCGSGCKASGADDVMKACREALERRGLAGKTDLKGTGCHGFCEKGPVMLVWPEGVFYNHVAARDAADIVASLTDGRRPVERLLYQDPATGERVLREEDVPFYARQHRVLFAQNGKIDPASIADYFRAGGYAAVARVLSATSPAEVVESVKRSGLRGRGGAGFFTGRKWEVVQRQAAETKYIICNADEGDPGAFMDRSLLEGNPHSVLEGMIIGAYAMGASEGFIYVRAEYPLAVERLRVAIAQAEEHGLLGDEILGSGLNFSIRLVEGAGAFVCGEETALIASIEGRVGEPRQRPPFPAEGGLWGKPTCINNVKTWASIPVIINRGADWYASIGTERSKGTMVFALVGKINNTGLVEVPMGITLREMIYGIGGGIPQGKQLKAVQIGGPSGGCIPASLLDLPIDYEALTEAGSMMGSGGMVVMDEDSCMVDVARYFMEFLEEESCGKCFSCREGLRRLHEIVKRITEGEGQEEDLDLLQELGWMVRETSLCGLGQTAPNPLLSTLRYFREEYEAHVREKRCPAKVCRKLITYRIDPVLCNGCGACVRCAALRRFWARRRSSTRLTMRSCTKCGSCLEVCQPKAVLVE